MLNKGDRELSQNYKTVREKFARESFVEKKSEFIASVARVENEDEAKGFVEKIKKEYPDATHNCYAYILKGTEIARFSDDGEPQGTAGMPILEVIKRENLVGVCVVVTRYFGGILLGAGGLVRAYAKGAKIGIDKAGAAEFCEHITFDFTVGYGEYEKVLRDMEKNNTVCMGNDFSENVIFHLSCTEENYENFCRYAADLTGGKCAPVVTGKTFAPKN